jgi:hypothetical protein
MNSPYNFVNNYQAKEIPSNLSLNDDRRVDNNMFNQIEGLIQNQFKITAPALMFEYKPPTNDYNPDFTGWDHDDLVEFFSHFGTVESLQVFGKTAIILFNSFIDAYTSREFLLNSSNFKESEKENFKVRWFTPQDEDFVAEPIRSKLKRYFITTQNEKINMSNKLSQSGSNGYYDFYSKGNPTSNTQSSSSSFYSYNDSGSSFNNSSGNNFKSSLNNQNALYKGYINENTEDSSSDTLQNGKYTCKFEIQIENDNEFQVARRLIGAKVK